MFRQTPINCAMLSSKTLEPLPMFNGSPHIDINQWLQRFEQLYDVKFCNATGPPAQLLVLKGNHLRMHLAEPAYSRILLEARNDPSKAPAASYETLRFTLIPSPLTSFVPNSVKWNNNQMKQLPPSLIDFPSASNVLTPQKFQTPLVYFNAYQMNFSLVSSLRFALK